jgi:methionine aminopeptidase
MQGKVADLLVATQTCSEAAIRLLKAGKTNEDITNAINKVSSHQRHLYIQKQNLIKNSVLLSPLAKEFSVLQQVLDQAIKFYLLLSQICVDFKVTPVAGVLSHNLDRFVIDGDKVIINSIKEAEHKVETFTFEPLQGIYCADERVWSFIFSY